MFRYLVNGITVLVILGSGGHVGGSLHQEPRNSDCSSRFLYEHEVLERLIKLELENSNLNQRLQQLEASSDKPAQQRVVLKVGLASNQELATKGRVLFNVEMWNHGNAYNLDTGEFVAPVSGVYFIVVQVCLTYTGQWMDLDIVKDGAVIGRVFSGDTNYHNCGSQSMSVHLEQASVIWVMRVGGTATVLNEDHGKNYLSAALIMQD